MSFVAARKYELHVPDEIAKRIRRCRASVRRAIEARLDEIAQAAAERRPSRRREPAPASGPPLRFYVFEGYRVFYRLDPRTRRIVVLELLVHAP